MYTLFISTYSSLLTIGILRNDKLTIKKEKVSERSHSVHLVPTIDEVINEIKITTNDLNKIIVINGPGSFTGVRLGVTVAKTLAYTLNIGIKTITSIDALAASDNKIIRKIVKVDDNKGSYYGIYQNNNLIDSIKYLNKEEFDKLLESEVNTIICTDNLDIEKINRYLKNKKEENPHSVKAVYIKRIEALNDK